MSTTADPSPGHSLRLIDIAIAVVLTAAVAAAIAVAPLQGAPRTLATYTLAPLMGVLSLLRRRWPLGVLLVSAMSIQIYNLYDNPGIFGTSEFSGE